MEHPVTLTMADQKRLTVLTELDRGRYTAAQAAEVLRVTVRHVRRLLARLRCDGVAAIPHHNRGRKPAHTLPDELRQQVVQLVKDKYSDCNNHHLQQLLAERENIRLSVSSLRRIRLAANQPSPRKRRAPKHRGRRERKPQAGIMLQIDGSPFPWLGPGTHPITLLAAIDDATNETFALFRHHEDTAGYLQLLRQVIRKRGIPLSVYSDRHTLFSAPSNSKPSVEDQLQAKTPQSQFARAAEELTITQIAAQSPQAKGRVERLFATLQDRLVQELRLEDIHTIEQANAFLPDFLKRHNVRFRRKPKDPHSAYRPPPKARQLHQILCLKYPRVVANDHTISFGGKTLELGPAHGISYARKRIIVQVALDGTISFWHQGQRIANGPKVEGELRTDPSLLAAQLPSQPAAPKPPDPLPITVSPKPRQTSAYKPPPDHPWRRPICPSRRRVVKSNPPTGG